MSRRLSGAWFKLVNQRGNYLGMLMMPEDAARHLEGKEYSYTTYRRPEPGAFPTLSGIQADMLLQQLHQFHIVKASYIAENAVFIIGITPDEIITEPGFAFLPSAEYIRAMLAPKPEPIAAEPKPELPGPYLAAAREFSA